MSENIELGIQGLSRFESIGSGGFATVYRAFDGHFQRWVAVKVLTSLGDEVNKKFERECQTMGRLDGHPNVVTPYRYGFTEQGNPYLVMEFAAAGSLQDLSRNRGKIEWAEAIGYVIPVARALAHSHSLGVLHHDVKPANILIGAQDMPKLADFGIASFHEMTVTNTSFTISHTAPETFQSGVDNRSESSDLYSLASTLYFLIAGRAPFDVEGQDSMAQYLNRVLTMPVPEVDDPAQTAFFRRALAKEPGDRPQSAGEFVTELEVVGRSANTTGSSGFADITSPALDDTLPISVPAPGPRRFNPLLVGALAIAVVAVLGIGLLINGLARGEEPASDPGLDSAGVVPIQSEPLILEPHENRVQALLMLADGRLASASAEQVRVWKPPESGEWTPDDPPTFEEAKIPGGEIFRLAQLDDQTLLASGFSTTVRLIDLNNVEAEPGSFECPDFESPVLAVVGEKILCGGGGGRVFIFDANDLDAEPALFDKHTDVVTAIAVLPNGTLASAGADSVVRIWSPDDPTVELATFDGHNDALSSIASHDGLLVATGDKSGLILVWNYTDPNGSVLRYKVHTRSVRTIDWIESGQLVASLDDGGQGLITNPQESDRSAGAYGGGGTMVVMDADGLMATMGVEFNIRIWRPELP